MLKSKGNEFNLKNRRVVITGSGTINPIGLNTENFWENCISGKTNVQKIPEQWFNYSNFNSKIWSPLPRIDYSKYSITDIEEKQNDISTLLSISCSFQAIDSAKLKYTKIDDKKNTFKIDSIDNKKAGVFIGTGIGGVNTLGSCFAYQILNNQKSLLNDLLNSNEIKSNKKIQEELISIINNIILPKRFNPFAVSMIMPNASGSKIAIKFNLQGMNNTFSSACASGTVAIGNGYNKIKNGEIDLAITGGVEYMHDEYGGLYFAFDTLKTLLNSDKYADIEKANKPFDKNRSGFLYSQGGCGILILEELEHAKKRAAPVIAEIIGYSENCDAHNIMMIEESGQLIKRMINQLLKESGISKEDVDYINAHGTGTILNDEIESKIIEEMFGKKILINSTKSIIGHTLGASGAIEAIVTALSIKDKKTHICKNLEYPIRDLNFVTKAKEYSINTAISQSFGFGGHNSAIALKEYI